jgi:hypothetical protein
LQNDAAFASDIARQAQQAARDIYALQSVQEKIESVIRQIAPVNAPQAPKAAAEAPIQQVA